MKPGDEEGLIRTAKREKRDLLRRELSFEMRKGKGRDLSRMKEILDEIGSLMMGHTRI